MRYTALVATTLTALVVGAFAPACCPAGAAVKPTETSAPAEPKPFVNAPESDAITREDGGIEKECPPFEAEACCDAMSEACLACDARQRQKRKLWAEGCELVQPVPETIDCGSPPPLTMCCRALLPRCMACADRNREVEAAWSAACGDASTPEVTP